jgi:hypothetical protein
VFIKRLYSQADPSLSRSSALLSAYKVLFFERIIGVTPAARALAHVEYFTSFLDFLAFGFAEGFPEGFVVGDAVEVCVGDAVGDGDVRVMGFTPAVIAYAGIENAVIDVMLQEATRVVSALASAVSTVKSIQMRVAFFTQEFPKYVGTKFNDSFYIKFDELPAFLAEGNLNDLAGGAEEVADCKTKTIGSAQVTCGQWNSIFGDAAMNGEGQLWDINLSTQSTNSAAFKCGGDKCYHGFIRPRIICRDLTDEHFGKELTLRMAVTDAGDNIFDSALAVDSIVFSTESCATGTFTKEDASKVTPAP